MSSALRLAFVFIAAAVAGCASDAPQRPATPKPAAAIEPAVARPLNEAELTRTLRGRTLEGLQSDRSYVRAYCAPDGRVSALVDATDGRKHWSGGTWAVRGETVCFRWKNPEWTSGCASIALNAGGGLNVKPLQGGPAINGAKTLDGNPYSLGFN